jgi:hypothetical protein
VASSLRRARVFADAACTGWQLDIIRNDAVAVASELVANAVVHARTGCRLVLRSGVRGLTIAVFDHQPGRLPAPRPLAQSEGVHGLFVVSELSLQWGVSHDGGEKSVWAFLPVNGAAAYPHTVRAAVHNGVRTVLAHGPNSPEAVTAVRHFVARLDEQHGPQFVQDVADELVVELLPIMLSNQDAAARRATWTAYRPRVETLMTILNQAATSAPQDRRSSLDQLHTAVSALTSAVDAYTTTPPPVDRENLGAIQEAQHWTEEALRAIERAQHSIT